MVRQCRTSGDIVKNFEGSFCWSREAPVKPWETWNDKKSWSHWNKGATETVNDYHYDHYVQRRPGWSKVLEMIQLDGARWCHKGPLHGQLGVHRRDGGCTRMHTDAQPAQGMAGMEILRSAWRRCGRIHCAVACLDYIITSHIVSPYWEQTDEHERTSALPSNVRVWNIWNALCKHGGHTSMDSPIGICQWIPLM